MTALSDDRKKEMARGRFQEVLDPQIISALAEGLSKEEIKSVVADILGKT